MRRMKKMKIFELLRMKDVGSIGIGAMIVFIAMVLVEGIAASVLIQTSTKLESQAMRTGSETIAEVATGLAVQDISGHVNSGSIDNVTIGTNVPCSELRVDKIKIDTNIISSTNTNGNIIIEPNGTGRGFPSASVAAQCG